uniref:Inter-alpha-trypsin inhibitor heavy chain family member 6 n=1 Tax=Terrapene triunguis TaxID=2587831 RepID=A0A674J4Q4_9SAUR
MRFYDLWDADVPPSTRVEKGSHCAWVVFTPTPQEQAAVSSSGILGDFVVQYDVAMPDVAGDVQIYNGYFVHYFAPRGLPPVQKNVVFVIDISGSMHGTKMKQTKKAMHIILSDLHPDDCFNIVTFSDTVHVWKAGRSILATAHNVRSAKDYVHRMEADGWTDINKALLEAASVLTQSTPEPSPTRIPLLIFLTDGEPTAGVTSGTRILANARQALGGSVSLFGLAFGDDADYGLLRRLALENRGVARRIYEDADATLQLAGFYDEIASPLLYDVALSYRDGADLTRTLFPHYFQGAELVVAGRLAPGATELHVEAAGHGHAGQLRLENDISANATEAALFGCSPDLGQIGRFVQRLWAYFTIQELLRARFHSNDTAARRLLTEKATNLSLKYNFVTPVTSLVVVKPEEEESTTARATPGAPGTPLTTTVAHRDGGGGGGSLLSPPPLFHPLLCLAVDGDPHFVARLPGSPETLCFTLDGHPGDVLQLVTDPPSGLSVHGHLVGAPPRPGSADRPRTYLDAITVRVGPPRLHSVITVTLRGVALQGEGALDLPFGRPAWVSRPGLGVRVGPGTNVTLQLGAGLEFVVQRHRYSHPSPLQRDHLGFYVLDGSGLSAQAHGLLGQFQNADIRLQPGAGERPARLQREWATVPATRVTKLLKDSPLPAHQAPCWLVKGSDVEALLGGAYSTFVVPHPLEA